MKALLLSLDCTITDLELPDERGRPWLRAAYEAIGCRLVDIVRLDYDLDMWVDDEGMLVENPDENINQLATRLCALFGPLRQCIYGNTILTGGADNEGETLGLSKVRARWVRERLG